MAIFYLNFFAFLHTTRKTRRTHTVTLLFRDFFLLIFSGYFSRDENLTFLFFPQDLGSGVKHFLLVVFSRFTLAQIFFRVAHFIALIIFFLCLRGQMERHRTDPSTVSVCISGIRVFALSVTEIVVGKQQPVAHRFSAKWKQRGKSENIRLNQMQIERFAVGNFQFSSPLSAPSSDRASVLSLDSAIPEKQTWN